MQLKLDNPETNDNKSSSPSSFSPMFGKKPVYLRLLTLDVPAYAVNAAKNNRRNSTTASCKRESDSTTASCKE